MEKVKKISKYVLNGLNMINALLIGLSPVWGFNCDKVVNTIVVITAVISAYLVSGKLFITEEVNNLDMEAEEEDIVEEE